ncbi:hypothetical protein [Desulfoscipio gibsoniae]|uniref:Uncharacterized protein n=1 Tax=Desulfoscipio gibsoniae DSM 7213 TaxID=767817 RepID=R4KG07_9FIRM|nr:hypothetical protein [Desulfoscipio gibsoniae]AGL00597.1 hypothetical protein Desgi_1068 [Desulfoscipio gibsoniae DSM 7213]
MKKNWISVFLAAVVLFASILVLLQEAGILGELARQSRYYYFWAMLSLLVGVLYAAASVLAWICWRRVGTVFFKWLTMALVLITGLWLESLLFGHMAPRPLASPGADLLDIIKRQVLINQLHNILLQQPGAILSAIFLVYALILWDGQVRLVEVFKPVWIMLLCLVFALGAAMLIMSMANIGGNHELFWANSGHVLMGSLVPAIYVYGIVAAQRKPPASRHRFLKWLVAYFALGVLTWLLTFLFSLVSSAIHLMWLTQFFIYTSQLFSLAMSVLIVIGLANFLAAAKFEE